MSISTLLFCRASSTADAPAANIPARAAIGSSDRIFSRTAEDSVSMNVSISGTITFVCNARDKVARESAFSMHSRRGQT
jgi:hypothetical protein